LTSLAIVYRSQGRYDEAEKILQQALAIGESTVGATHPYVIRALDNLAILSLARGDAAGALDWSRRATAGMVAYANLEALDADVGTDASGQVDQRTGYFLNHLRILSAAADRNLLPGLALGREAIEVAQRVGESSVASAMQQMATRFAVGDDVFAALVRESQDLAAELRNKNRMLISELSRLDDQRRPAEIETLRKGISETESRIAEVATRLNKEFPGYAALMNPKPLTADEVQALLTSDEAIVFWASGKKQTYVFALTRDKFDWRTIPIGKMDLAAKVAAFRHGLDVQDLAAGLEQFKRTGKQPDLFDLTLAFDLYSILLGPVEEIAKNKSNLLVVPTGPLTGLPFHLLVTERPAGPAGVQNLAAYRDAAWLVKRQAVTVLPSIASLRALRTFAGQGGESAKPLIGFGDPVFGAEKPMVQPSQRVAVSRSQSNAGGKPQTIKADVATAPIAAVPINSKLRAYTEYWRGVGVDREQLAGALPPLPETAGELKAVAHRLNAPLSDIHLGRDASETTLKHARLGDYRVVYFATHGLVAGDVKDLAEPSLALSLPPQPTDVDDGLLTASEVAQLKLNADWVVLSACNTAAGERPGAEALSGLARAFFYAGARALLVSHWAVDSDAATRLTTTTFDFLMGDPTIGRGEALRRAMLAYLSDRSEPRSAYPAFWGPFSIVGEGTAR
jgi:CHAT domain-containing protein